MDISFEARELLNKTKSHTKHEMVDILIELGDKNIFIPVMIEFMKIARAGGEHDAIQFMEACMNSAYSPGLRAHILDDFIRAKLAIQTEINELKTQHNIYVLEQKLFMYKKVEEMLRTTATNGCTYEIMKILEFRDK